MIGMIADMLWLFALWLAQQLARAITELMLHIFSNWWMLLVSETEMADWIDRPSLLHLERNEK